MFPQSSKQILVGTFVALVLMTMPAYAIKKFKVSSYGGGHQIWFEAEDFDERNPDTAQYYPVVDAAGAFGKAVSRAGGAGGMIRWTFDISKAGGRAGTWYFWGRILNPSNQSDFMLVEGHPGDPVIPTGPPFPGGSSDPLFNNEDDRIFEETITAWDWWGNSEGSDKQLKNGENTMYIFHRQGDNTVFWDVFVWSDNPNYVPTDADYQNAIVPLPGAAADPSPANNATDVPRDVALSWTPGEFAAPVKGHKVYFSEKFNDVNDRVGGVTQTVSTYTPSARLDFDKTYYWCVDEIDAPPSSTVRRGSVWSFTTEPFAYPAANVIATASSSSADKGPENTVNGSGLDSTGLLHGNAGSGTMWLSDISAPPPTWIMFELENVCKLHQMWVWNYNESLELVIGIGIKEAVIEYSTNGTDFTPLGTTHQFNQGSGAAGYAHNTTIDFGGVQAKYVKLTAQSNFKNLLPQFGLSEVRFFTIPAQAREPSPASGAMNVALDATLGWRAGREAAKHNLYLSADWNAVLDGTAPVTTVTGTRHGPLALDIGTTYFWRVDEVNDVETPATWQGNVWNFTTIKSLVVDNFEGYNAADNQIWYTWKDGLGYGSPTAPPYYAGNGTGSAVGDENTKSFTEEMIVHGGKQSMPLSYNNNKQGALKYSEVTMTLSNQRDWTARGVKELSLWFRGYPGSVGSFVEAPAGTYTLTAGGADIWGTADQFHFAYKQLSGVGSIAAKVESVQNTNVWAKAGVMIRETLDAGSKFAAVYITPTNADGTPTNGCRFQGRTDTNGSATSDTSVATAEQMAIKAPYWVKLERDAGGNFRGYYASDGVNWKPMVWRPSISMGSNVYIGLALTSHDVALTGQAKFSNVTTTGTVTGQWQSQDVGLTSNSAERMYVAIANKTGAPVLAFHDNPAATQIDTWTQWRIGLQQFADQGINLANVDSISIGAGDKNNPKPGGSGKMYFDDIELYPASPVQTLKEANKIFEAESADTLGSSWRINHDAAASGGTYIGSNNGDGSDGDTAPGAVWVASYKFTATAGIYKVVTRVIAPSDTDDSLWVRIVGATSQTHEDPDQPRTGWVRFNGIDLGSRWHWDEVHSNDHNDEVVNWTLPAGEHTLEIAKREDGTLLDAILITDDLALDQTTLP